MNRFWIRSAPGMLAMALGALVCVQRSHSQTAWKTATDGNWNDGTKWSDGVPTNNAANLTPTGADYTVTVNDPPANPFKDLTIQQATGDKTTTLDVNADGFRSEKGLIAIRRGAVVNVNAGGVMGHSGGRDSADHFFLDVSNGGVWNVAGGTVAFANLAPATSGGRSYAYIGNTGEGHLNISSGTFLYTAAAGNGNNQLMMGAGTDSRGFLTMTGGTLVHRNDGNAGMQVARGLRSYGKVSLTNDAVIVHTNWLYVAGGNLSTGIIEVAGNALFDNINSRVIIGGGENAIGAIAVTENGDFTVRGASTGLWLGGYDTNSGGGTGILNIAGGQVLIGTATLGGRNLKQYSNTYGEINLSNGRLDSPALRGGMLETSNAVGRAVFNVSGGSMTIGGVVELGVVQTHAVAPLGHANSISHGTLNLSGSGVVTNSGDLYLGRQTGGTGEVFQSGGAYVQTGSTRKTCIGHRGGFGAYEVTGGSFSSQGAVYVGGETAEGFPDSPGLLTVRGGVFQTTHSMFVGQAGQGTVTVGGGTLSVGSLNLASADATLGFEFSEGATGVCSVSGTLTIDPDAKLEIDATGAAANVNYTLVSCNARSGSFDIGNITVIGGDPAWVDQDTDQNLHFRIPTGTIVMLR